MAEHTQFDWITSDEKIATEQRFARRLLPVAKVVSTLAVVEPDHSPMSLEDRALLPDEVYQITKIGNRGPLGARDPSRRVSELLSVTMLDELPHLQAVLDGTASLHGPRGTAPDHRARLFKALDAYQQEEWREILSLQKHGVINSYALRIHTKSGSQISYDDEANLADEQVYNEALVRFTGDCRDFYNASASYDRLMRKKFAKMILSRATGGRIGVLREHAD